MRNRIILLLTTILVALIIVSSFMLISLVRLNDELIALKREYGEYWCNSDWVTKFVGRYPITSAEQASQTYLMLVDKAPRKSYWIFGLALGVEVSEVDSFYKANGTFRNYAVNCPDAKLVIVYSIYKNGTATLENVKTVCSGHEYQEYP